MLRSLARFAAALLVLTSVPVTAAPAADTAPALDVPFLPQTEALCGGAAAAMLFRFWGQRHADARPFEPLIDRERGGIPDSELVLAIRARGWRADRLDGSVAVLDAELAARRPPLILIEDRPQRYHFVVVVSLDADAVRVHDPAWGPSRLLRLPDLERAWKATGYWTLRVTPLEPPTPVQAPEVQAPAAEALTIESPCAPQLEAVLASGAAGATLADPLQRLREQCPRDSRVLAELAAARFAERRWTDAATLARSALAYDPSNAYAADVLGASLFLANDPAGALRAWNVVGRPLLDSVQIRGLTRTRYAHVALALGLTPNTLLTARDFTLARRRLESLPDQAATRLSLRPDAEGFAVLDAAIVERATIPRNPVQWLATAAESVLEREVTLAVPGGTGQGELWSASWRWWRNRPRATVEFAAPRIAWPRGVWRVRGSWESQAYGAASTGVREERLRGQLVAGDWLSASVHAEAQVGLDAWTRADGRRERTIRVGATLEHRLLDDRFSATATLAHWSGLGAAASFGSASLTAGFRSRREPRGLVLLGRAGATAASSQAPLAVWNGAGEGRGRGPLLRAHRLLQDGRITGTIFGRRLAHATIEAQGWLPRLNLVRLGTAVFVDAASAQHRPFFATGRSSQVDVGVGMRVRVPGKAGVLRVDYARGLMDGARAIVATWQPVD